MMTILKIFSFQFGSGSDSRRSAYRGRRHFGDRRHADGETTVTLLLFTTYRESED